MPFNFSGDQILKERFISRNHQFQLIISHIKQPHSTRNQFFMRGTLLRMTSALFVKIDVFFLMHDACGNEWTLICERSGKIKLVDSMIYWLVSGILRSFTLSIRGAIYFVPHTTKRLSEKWHRHLLVDRVICRI